MRPLPVSTSNIPNLNPVVKTNFQTSLDNNTIPDRSDRFKATTRQYRMLSRLTYGLQVPAPYPYKFITLTSANGYNDPDLTYHDWTIFRKRLKRKYPDMQYIWVLVKSKKGKRWHIHIIARVDYIDQNWLSENWYEIHHSPIVYIEAVSDDNVAGEIMKNTKLMNYMLGNAQEGGSKFRWGMSRRWIVYSKWRKAMKLLVANRGYDWFVSEDGKQAYQSILQGKAKVEKYLWKFSYIRTYTMTYVFLRTRQIALEKRIWGAKTYNPVEVLRKVIFKE